MPPRAARHTSAAGLKYTHAHTRARLGVNQRRPSGGHCSGYVFCDQVDCKRAEPYVRRQTANRLRRRAHNPKPESTFGKRLAASDWPATTGGGTAKRWAQANCAHGLDRLASLAAIRALCARARARVHAPFGSVCGRWARAQDTRRARAPLPNQSERARASLTWRRPRKQSAPMTSRPPSAAADDELAHLAALASPPPSPPLPAAQVNEARKTR